MSLRFLLHTFPDSAHFLTRLVSCKTWGVAVVVLVVASVLVSTYPHLGLLRCHLLLNPPMVSRVCRSTSSHCLYSSAMSFLLSQVSIVFGCNSLSLVGSFVSVLLPSSRCAGEPASAVFDVFLRFNNHGLCFLSFSRSFFGLSG